MIRPGSVTAIPSAMVVPPGGSTGRPSACAIAAYRSDCTPTISMSGRACFTATAMPAMRPPPPTGTTSTSRSGRAASISSATVPWPAMIAGSSNAGTSVAPVRVARSWASAVASVRVAPVRTTWAPRVSVRVIFVNGRPSGMTIVASMPSSRAWWATPWAWLPAEAATTPLARCAASSPSRKLRAPRSLNEAVYWKFSNLRTISAPVISDSVREAEHGVSTTAPRIRSAAAATSSAVTGKTHGAHGRVFARLGVGLAGDPAVAHPLGGYGAAPFTSTRQEERTRWVSTTVGS